MDTYRLIGVGDPLLLASTIWIGSSGNSDGAMGRVLLHACCYGWRKIMSTRGSCCEQDTHVFSQFMDRLHDTNRDEIMWMSYPPKIMRGHGGVVCKSRFGE